MADEEINDQTAKSADADSTDELWGQVTAGGGNFKVTAANIFASLGHARARTNSSAGGLKSGSVGVTSVDQVSTGVYDWTLSEAVTSILTAQLIPSTGTAGAEISAKMTSTTVARVTTTVAGTAFNVQHSLMIFDEA